MPRRLATTLLCTLLLLGACATDASAYCLRRVKGHAGHPAWSARKISFYISSSLVEIGKRLAVANAFASWSQVPCAALLVDSAGAFEPSEAPISARGFGIYVYWHTSPSDWPLARHDVVATSLISVDSGGIVRAAIAVNAFKYRWSTDGSPGTLDVQGELTALVGQVLGLGDSDSDDSVMSKTLRFADVHKRTLRDDDKAALRVLYPDERCAPTPGPGPDGCGAPVLEATTSKRLVSSDTPPAGAAGQGCAGGCSTDEICSAQGRCVGAGSVADDAGGCAISARGGGASGGAGGAASALLLLLAALLSRAIRRARCR